MEGQVRICVFTVRKSVMCGENSERGLQRAGSELAAGLFSCPT